MTQVRITSQGMASNTRVSLADGANFPPISAIHILTIEPESVIKAEITLTMPLIDIEATAFLSMGSLEAAATHYGLKLVAME